MDSLRLQGDEEVSPSFRAWIPFEWSFSSECGKEVSTQGTAFVLGLMALVSICLFPEKWWYRCLLVLCQR